MRVELAKGKKQLGILIDPDKAKPHYLNLLSQYANSGMFDFFLVGGSIVFNSVQHVVDFLKLNTRLPVVLFPGDLEQIVFNADAILFLSLLSGRNPEYLIGKHVIIAHQLKNSDLQVIPTGYILISSQNPSAVQYITQTQPIPRDKPQLAVATAIAGQLLGFHAIYLEAGSNAAEPVAQEVIEQVSQNIEIPLIVGGGIRTPNQLLRAYNSGADIVVIGNAVEQSPELIPKFFKVLKKVRKNESS